MKTEDNRGIKGRNRKFPRQINLEAKRYLIVSDIASGMTYMDIVRKYEKEWGLSHGSVMNIVNDCVEYMRSEKAKDTLVSINMQRLENIIADSMQEGDRKNAIKAIDTQNKLVGGYEEKVKIDADSEINLVFDF